MGIGDVKREVTRLENAETLHAARLPRPDGLLTTDGAVADERETMALVEVAHRDTRREAKRRCRARCAEYPGRRVRGTWAVEYSG